MSSNLPEAQELLRLFKCVVDTGADVLVPFAEDKLLKSYNGNFERFLDDKKHEIFHLWHSKKLLCCACPPTGCTLKRTGHMDNWIFEKIYDGVGIEHGGHIIRNSGKVVQMCLHKYVTRNIGIHELDIVALSFLLQNFAALLPNEDTALATIKSNRNKICHAYPPNCYDMNFLNTAWTELEKSLVDLTSPSYKGVMKKQIKYLRKVDLEKEEIMELLSNVEEALQELKSSCNNNGTHVKGMISRLENMLTNNTKDIKQVTTEQTTQAQNALSEKIQNTENKLENSIKQEVKDVKDSFQTFGTQLDETRSEIKNVKENQEKKQVEILKAIQNLTLSVKYERPAYLLVPEETCEDSMECPVFWQIATPKHWNLEAVEATLRNPSNNDEQFKKKFVRKGSLIMLTTIAANILRDPKSFETAVLSFLTKMIEDCDINTEIPCRVDVRLHILNHNEVSLSCELPTEVQNKPGIKNKRNDCEEFDVVFLNSDHKNEFKWVRKMSTLLKEQYDIPCAIPAKDYLYGFPLKSRLFRYLKKFKVVILTLTEKNYSEYNDYIDSEMPIIAVELNYISRIRENLWDNTYINCTICEHLWFPRLIDILKSKLPDILNEGDMDVNCERSESTGIFREWMKNVDGEMVVDCKKCEDTATTSVFHMAVFRTKLGESKLLLCGSLTDEAWILLLLNQLTKVGDPKWIFKWYKKIESQFTSTPSIVFFLVSPNLQRCPSIIEYVNSVVKDKTIAVYSLKIAPAESPQFDGDLRGCIDGTNRDLLKLAQEILLVASSCMNPPDYSSEHSQKMLPFSEGNESKRSYIPWSKTGHDISRRYDYRSKVPHFVNYPGPIDIYLPTGSESTD